MNMFTRLLTAWVIATSFTTAQAALVVIANATVQDHVEIATLSRIYTGRMIVLNGTGVNPVNLASGSPARQQFLQHVLNQDDDKYIGYWIVRRSIGKGAPPREFATTQEIIDYVANTPGAIGYIDSDSNLPSSVKVLLKN
ncbi:type 2 periplasmic-binding domain-containing protein [Thiomicrospira microaerophila]|uniref:hypothetical protein n=1 Tax=Thiomicrospira microaerophila TaxID=406020 RepID=UPI0005C942C6|nr:hypothetical protein [Thiomicrospira microaerophila]